MSLKPQISKPKATVARNPNSNPWENPGSVEEPVLLWPDEQTLCDYDSRLHYKWWQTFLFWVNKHYKLFSDITKSAFIIVVVTVHLYVSLFTRHTVPDLHLLICQTVLSQRILQCILRNELMNFVFARFFLCYVPLYQLNFNGIDKKSFAQIMLYFVVFVMNDDWMGPLRGEGGGGTPMMWSLLLSVGRGGEPWYLFVSGESERPFTHSEDEETRRSQNQVRICQWPHNMMHI